MSEITWSKLGNYQYYVPSGCPDAPADAAVYIAGLEGWVARWDTLEELFPTEETAKRHVERLARRVNRIKRVFKWLRISV